MTNKMLMKLLATTGLISGITLGNLGIAQGVTFTPPDKGSPDQGAAASSRSSGDACSHGGDSLPTQSSVTPLLPQGNYGRTIAEHPEILVYIPDTEANQALFSLKNEDKVTHYQMIVPLSGQAGIIRVQLPQDAPPLAVGETYKWYLALQCEGSLRPSNPVEGKIERIEATSVLTTDIDSIEAAESYGSEGIWYDTVATLARLRTKQPMDTNVTQHWQELLNSVGLTEIVDVSLGEF